MRICIAIVEDDARYAQQLYGYIQQFEASSGHKFEVKLYSDGEGLVEHYKAQFDIILMDIEMPFMDGMTAADHIRQVDPEVVIIFITNMPQYAIQGYAVGALDYVLKPVSYFAFTQRLERAIQRMRRREKAYMTVPVKGGAVKLEIQSIYYVESSGHRLTYCTRSGDHIDLSGSIQQAETALERYGFFRCNKGCLVNLDHVERIQDECVVVDGKPLPISRRKRTAFLEALANYVSETTR